jgi:predicted RNA-binding Zn-ribbon protein involved in translation (DUF1610 family)
METLIRYTENGSNLTVNVSTMNIVHMNTSGTILTSFAEGNVPDGGSLGKIIAAYKAETNYDLSSASIEIIEDNSSGLIIGKVQCPYPTRMFGSLWFVQLPKDYSHTTLSELYTALKKYVHLMTVDGTIVMPLLGSHPEQGVSPFDVLEEVMGFVIYCSKHAPQVHTVTILMREEPLMELKQRFSADTLLPSNIGPLIQEIREIVQNNAASQPEEIIECFRIISTSYDLCINNFDDPNIQLLLLSTICLQSRRVLEVYVRKVSGDNRMNAGFPAINDLHSKGLISNIVAEQSTKLIRSGNKAAHTDSGNRALTSVEACLSLQCVATVLKEFSVNNFNVLPSNQISFNRTVNFKAGDWNCPNCNHHNFGFRVECRECGTVNQNTGGTFNVGSQSMESNMLPGDWNCLRCGSHNFASRDVCRDCNTPKSGVNQATMNTMSMQDTNFKPGDWNCPSCGSHNFASRDVCRDCNTPKSGGTQTFSNQAPMNTVQNTGFKAGDWNCPSCGSHNFASRNTCRDCNTPKSGGSQSFVGQIPMNTVQNTGLKAGDWNCPSCGNHNFASRDKCRGCGGSKYGGSKSNSNSKFKAGDWKCTNCGNHNFASRDKCRACSRKRTFRS